MKFDQLVKQLLVLEADDRYLGRSLEKLGPRGLPGRSSMPESDIVPDEDTYKRGTYIRTGDDATKAEMQTLSAVEGEYGDPEKVREMKQLIDDIVNKLSSVIKDESGQKESASGKMLQILSTFQQRYSQWKSRTSKYKQLEMVALVKDTVLQQHAEQAAEAYDQLCEIASQGFAAIKSSFVKHPDIRRALDVLARLKDFLGDRTPAEGEDHTPIAKIAVMHDLNRRLLTSLIKRSEAPLTRWGSAKQQLTGDRQKLLKLVKGDRFKKSKADAIMLADNDMIRGAVIDFYAGKITEAQLSHLLLSTPQS